MNANESYPTLMAYIAERSTSPNWYKQLCEDEQAAMAGGLADVAADMQRAKADFAEQQRAAGKDLYPYNRDMGLFLGLPIRDNGEPPRGYYMAGQVTCHYRLGVAQREIARLIEEGRELAIVTARSTTDRKPIRFARFRGQQIRIEGNSVTLDNGRRKYRLSSNWSVETCLEAVAAAMRTGRAYGESA